MKWLAGEHHLEAVELGRIVRAGDLESAVGPERGDAEVERRRGHHTHVDRGGAGVGDTLPDPCGERWPDGRLSRPTAMTGARPSAPSRRWRTRAPEPGRARA